MLLSSLWLAACSSPGTPAAATAEAQTQAQRQTAYLTAATAYNTVAARVAKAETTYCDPRSPGADLVQCQMALGQDRQATLAYDRALRDVPFEGQARADVTQLLADDASLETLLEQAATAPTLDTVAQLNSQLLNLLAAAAADASKVRADLGLPTASPG